MLFSWLRARRRRKLLAEPFPIRWVEFLNRNVRHYALLSANDQSRLRDIARILIAEKEWLGRGGLFVNEEMKVTVAAQAALLLLGDERGYFANVAEIVVFPSSFRSPRPEDNWEDDELSENDLSGQAVYRGPVLLAWNEVMGEGRDPEAGYNVVVHEFAHQLDFLDGVSGGVPRLGDRALETRWRYVMTVAFEDHRRATAAKNPDAFFTPHAAENETEFFADASEAFFCRPIDLKELHPEVYQLLAAYYRLDPVQWFSNEN